jgi:hypothetical protein
MSKIKTFELCIDEQLANELQEIAEENGMILIRESNNHERELVGI